MNKGIDSKVAAAEQVGTLRANSERALANWRISDDLPLQDPMASADRFSATPPRNRQHEQQERDGASNTSGRPRLVQLTSMLRFLQSPSDSR